MRNVLRPYCNLCKICRPFRACIHLATIETQIPRDRRTLKMHVRSSGSHGFPELLWSSYFKLCVKYTDNLLHVIDDCGEQHRFLSQRVRVCVDIGSVITYF